MHTRTYSQAMLTYPVQSLSSTVEKQSPSLGREVQYESTALITRLPAYLPVQLIRFYVGRSGASEEIVSKKILKVLHVLRA